MDTRKMLKLIRSEDITPDYLWRNIPIHVWATNYILTTSIKRSDNRKQKDN